MGNFMYLFSTCSPGFTPLLPLVVAALCIGAVALYSALQLRSIRLRTRRLQDLRHEEEGGPCAVWDEHVLTTKCYEVDSIPTILQPHVKAAEEMMRAFPGATVHIDIGFKGSSIAALHSWIATYPRVQSTRAFNITTTIAREKYKEKPKK